jgi:hypothetical protein
MSVGSTQLLLVLEFGAACFLKDNKERERE